MIGVISKTDGSPGGSYGVESGEFKTPKHHRGWQGTWWFEESMLELVDTKPSVAVPTHSVCPRCGGELKSKNTDTYGTISKCQKCGWC
jgi:hypothetical protein